jgi:hypothetical protein
VRAGFEISEYAREYESVRRVGTREDKHGPDNLLRLAGCVRVPECTISTVTSLTMDMCYKHAQLSSIK